MSVTANNSLVSDLAAARCAGITFKGVKAQPIKKLTLPFELRWLNDELAKAEYYALGDVVIPEQARNLCR